MTKKNKAKNASQVVKGTVKESVGKVTGNDKLESDGKVDQMEGHVRQAGENLKDAFKE